MPKQRHRQFSSTSQASGLSFAAKDSTFHTIHWPKNLRPASTFPSLYIASGPFPRHFASIRFTHSLSLSFFLLGAPCTEAFRVPVCQRSFMHSIPTCHTDRVPLSLSLGEASGCILDQLEKVCEGEAPELVAPAAEENLWMCCASAVEGWRPVR